MDLLPDFWGRSPFWNALTMTGLWALAMWLGCHIFSVEERHEDN